MSKFFVSIVFFAAWMLIRGEVAEARRRPSAEPKKEFDLSAVAEPKDQEVCFSPAEACDLKLIQLIRSAKKSIDIAIYDITRDQIAHHLILASKKIPVRVVADRRQAKGDHSLIPLLIKAGVKVKFGRQRGTMHNKFTIVDGKFLETGSFNYTKGATESNHENQVYLANPAIVERYKVEFEDLWQNGFLEIKE